MANNGGNDDGGWSSKWKYDVFKPLTIDDYFNGVDNNLFPVETHGDTSFTGVWEASKTFLTWLEKSWFDVVLPANNESPPSSLSPTSSSPVPFAILELGSGTGSLGIHLAYNLHQMSFNNEDIGDDDAPTQKIQYVYNVTLSDTPTNGGYFWTKANLDMAMQQENNARGDDEQTQDRIEEKKSFEGEDISADGKSNLTNVNVIPFDWACEEHRQKVSKDMDDWDLIIGSEIIYSVDGCAHLSQAMLSLLMNETQQHQQGGEGELSSGRKQRKIIIGYISRFLELDFNFQIELEKRGLKWKILEKIPLTSWSGKREVEIYEISL